MVQLSPLDQAFAALADPTRRAILERLRQGEATVGELAGPTGMSLTGFKKHVTVLEQAGLVATEKRGRSRHCRLGPQRLDEADRWIDEYRRDWSERFDRLDQLLVQRKSNPKGTDR